MKILKRKANILIIEHGVSVTGAFNAILGISLALAEEFNFLFVIPKKSSCIPILNHYNIKNYNLKYALFNRNLTDIFLFLPRSIMLLLKLSSIVKREKISIIHINDIYNIIPYFLILFFPRLKIIVHIRLRKSAFPKVLYDIMIFFGLKFARRIIVVSDTILNENKKLINNDKVRRIYDGLNIQERIPFDYSCQDENGNVQLLYLANYIPGKGHEIMIRAFSVAIKFFPGLKLTMAGDDMGLIKNKEYKESLNELSINLGLTDKVKFLKRVEDVEKLYKSHHIFINLSLQESFSFTCLESLFFGIPCIAYDSGGPSEILKNGEYGILLNNLEPEHVGKKIIDLIRDKDKRLKLSKTGRQYVLKEFSFTSAALEYHKVYTGLI